MLGLDDKSSEAAPETDEDKLIHSIKLGIYAMQQGKTFEHLRSQISFTMLQWLSQSSLEYNYYSPLLY